MLFIVDITDHLLSSDLLLSSDSEEETGIYTELTDFQRVYDLKNGIF
jgi:hypothetical protein